MTSKLNINWLNKCRCGNRMHTVETVRGSHVRLFEDDAVKCSACGREGVIQTCDAIATVLWETDEERAESVTMTKSTITRERVQWLHDAATEFASTKLKMTMRPDEVLALTSALLAAKDSEPEYLPLDYLQGHRDGLEWAAQLAESNHPETGGRLYDDPIELAKAIRKGPDMPPVQPVPVVSADLLHTAASAIEDLLTTKDRTGAGVWFDLPFKLRSAANAQLAPVVPDDVLDALQKVARIRLELNDFDGDRRGIAFCLSDAEEALIEVVNRRAAMLAAASQEVKHD